MKALRVAFLLIIGAILVAPVWAPSRAQTGSTTVQQPKAAKPILAQAKLGEMACGPCALFNSFTWGDPALQKLCEKLPGKNAEEKVEGWIELYGSKPSEEYAKKKPRFTPKDGITWVDFHHFANDLFRDHEMPELAGSYLDRRKDEKLVAHLHRIHKLLRQSLDAGLPPIIAFRSFAARVEPNGKDHKWHGLRGHWVCAVEIPQELAENEKGFRFGYLDSFTGKQEYGYAAIDEARNFSAAKGNAEKWEWLADRPFLLVTAPSLRLKTQDVPWYDRTIIILNYAVYRTK